MKKTFVCDDSMIITIPIGGLRDAREGQLMPEKFQCVYRDHYKVFAVKGKPKPLGVSSVVSYTDRVMIKDYFIVLYFYFFALIYT